jgi:hypothetical protein
LFTARRFMANLNIQVWSCTWPLGPSKKNLSSFCFFCYSLKWAVFVSPSKMFISLNPCLALISSRVYDLTSLEAVWSMLLFFVSVKPLLSPITYSFLYCSISSFFCYLFMAAISFSAHHLTILLRFWSQTAIYVWF